MSALFGSAQTHGAGARSRRRTALSRGDVVVCRVPTQQRRTVLDATRSKRSRRDVPTLRARWGHGRQPNGLRGLLSLFGLWAGMEPSQPRVVPSPRPGAVAVTNSEREQEREALRAAHEALLAETERLRSTPSDLMAHHAHLEKLRAHNARLHALSEDMRRA
jgi:hypothetical protein